MSTNIKYICIHRTERIQNFPARGGGNINPKEGINLSQKLHENVMTSINIMRQYWPRFLYPATTPILTILGKTSLSKRGRGEYLFQVNPPQVGLVLSGKRGLVPWPGPLRLPVNRSTENITFPRTYVHGRKVTIFLVRERGLASPAPNVVIQPITWRSWASNNQYEHDRWPAHFEDTNSNLIQ